MLRYGARAGARGQMMIEFALVIPIFLLLLFGSVEMGILYKTNSAYLEAAQQAVRVAASAGHAADADQQALTQLARTLPTEDLSQITSVTIFDATVGGTYAVTPTTSAPYDNAHTDYVYSPSAGAFVCKAPPPSTPPCTGQSYWDPATRSTIAGALDHVGIKIVFNYRSPTGLVRSLKLMQTAVSLMEPTAFSP